MILTQRTQLEADLLDRDASILRGAEALHHAAAVMRSEHSRFWAMPTDRLLAMLNHDVQATLALFQANSVLATNANTVLDALALPQFPTRAPVAPGRTDILFDGTSFTLQPVAEEPVLEEPTPSEPAPEQ